MKILAVGDVHTKTWMFYEIAELVDFYDHIVFVGDFVDNFNTAPTQSMAAWRLMRQFMQAEPKKVHALIGNHDYAYIHNEIAGRSSGFNHMTFTLINTPQNKKIKDWLLGLPLTLELDGVLYSHAGVTNEWTGKDGVLDVWNDASPIWARPKQLGGQVTYKDVPQVFGHNPSKKIWNPEPKAWCIDTFSQDQNNNYIGDKTLLEVVDGKEFNVIELKEINENNSNTSSVEDTIS